MKNFVFILFLLALSACQTTPQKKPLAAEKGAELVAKPHLLATQMYQQFRQSGKPDDLILSIALASAAHTKSPDDVNVQEIFYKTQYMKSLLTKGEGLTQLTAIYGSLNPALAVHLAPPSKIPYFLAEQQKAPLSRRIELLSQVIVDQPAFADSWYQLSQLYGESSSPWLALYPAQRALSLQPDTPEYRLQVAIALRDITFSKSCPYESGEFTKASLPLFLTVATTHPTAYVYDEIAYAYLHLGLPPLAYDQAKKSWQIEADIWNANHLAQAAYLLGKNDEAQKVATQSATQFKSTESELILTALAIEKNQWAEATQHINTFAAYYLTAEPDSNTVQFFAPLLQMWVKSMASAIQTTPQMPNIKPQSKWTKQLHPQLQDFFGHKNAINLNTLAKDRCEHTEALFYEAMAHWYRGEMQACKEKLLEVRKQNTLLFHENILAKAILKSGVLEPKH